MSADEPELRARSERVKALALALGFDRAGIAPAEASERTRFFADWLARGHAGEMHWLARRSAERIDPQRVLPGARSIVALGFVYDPGAAGQGDDAQFRIARYAGGDDYHEVLIERVRLLEAALKEHFSGPPATRGYVDTGPVLERVHAARAGLGWIGKNTCLIDPELGSYLFLAVVLTDLELAFDAPEPDHCGSCRACLDACPTQAFPEPGVLDATRCLAYTTIELRGAIPEELRAAHGERGFGCDLCQEVCPWNQRRLRAVPPDPFGLRARISPRPEWQGPALAWLLALTREDWQRATKRTALRRSGYTGLLRNALVVAGNSGDRSLLPLIEAHAAGSDPLLAEHARWALARLQG